MKQCPQCSQIYSDDTLNFCLADGASLKSFSNLSEPTIVLNPQRSVVEPMTNKAPPPFAYVLIIAALALIAGGAIATFFMSRTPNIANDKPSPTPLVANSEIANKGNSAQPPANIPDQTVKYPDTNSPPLTAEVARNVISVWQNAQQNKSFASYQSCYDRSFVGVKKTKSGHSQTYTYASWMADRRKMISAAVNLNIELQNLQVRVQGDTAIIQFDQYYRSLKYSDWGPKEIVIKMTPAGAKIVREELKASYPL